MAFQGVILDIDGTLVLSNDIQAQAWCEAFADAGYDIPFERVRPLIGKGGDKVIPELVPDLNDQEGTGKTISERRKELVLNRYAPTLAPTRGARDLVLRLKEDELTVVIASSATEAELEVLLKVAQIEGLVQEATTSSDAEASKPAPDIVAVALKKLQMDPSQVVMIGDTPYDIESAAQCGIGVIALRCGGFSDSQLAEALAIYDDPADLVAQYADSPLGRSNGAS